VHDQDAYVVDQNKLGSFSKIGYEAPNSKYFTYTSTLEGETEGTSATWTATPGTKGPNCNSAWTVTSTSDGEKATHTPKAGCEAMTPNFSNIGGTGS